MSYTTTKRHTHFSALRDQRGFTLIEILIATCIFLILATSIYFTYANILDVINWSRSRTLATSLLNRQIEMIRALPYGQVGIIGGSPAGLIPATSSIMYEGQEFTVYAFARNIDDSFDGTQGGSPNDTAPADYRMIELRVECESCQTFVPATFTIWAAAQNLETSTNNGSLFIDVFDANGQPVGNANVLVQNSSTSPTITISDTTNNSGTLQLVDIATSTNAYRVTVTKNGYTSARTYSFGDPTNPNPIQPHATVASQQITDISFAIDRVSSISVQTQDQYCAAVPSVSIVQEGQKLIGASPNVLAYSQSFTTDGSGRSTRGSLSWDTYSFRGVDSVYDLAGSIPALPLTLAPNTSTPLGLLVEAISSSSLLVSLKDATGTPVRDATVSISGSSYSGTQLSGEKFFAATDWSSSAYSSQDGNVETENVPGQATLRASGGVYPTSTNSYLISNTIDFGTSTTVFHELFFNPTSQPTNTTLRLQLASASSASGPWSFVGPDGTAGTYYSSASSTIGTYHDSNRYLRYKAYLNTTDDTATPSLTDVTLSFASGCVPSGQVFWRSLPTGTYTVTASKTGLTTASSSIIIGNGWQQLLLDM